MVRLRKPTRSRNAKSVVTTPASTRARPLRDLRGLCVAVTEHAPLPMATVEGATHILRYVNPAFSRMMNRPARLLVGRPLGEVLPRKDACFRLLDRVFRNGKPESFTEAENSKSHPVFWSYTMWPVLADARLVGVMIQVTETTAFHDKAIAMNEALVLGSVRQHELTEAAENLNAQLRVEIDERTQAEKALSVARVQLAEYAGHLEELVTKRTAELTVTNQRLKISVTTIRKAQAEYHALFLASEAMQRKLRHLTRQILATQEEERKKISRELHDEVVQTLVGINVELTALRDELAAKDPKLQEKIAGTQRLVDTAGRIEKFKRKYTKKKAAETAEPAA